MRVLKILLLAVVLLGAALLALWAGLLPVPPAWNPWAPLDVRAAPNLLTRFKLLRLRDDPALCDQVLKDAGLRVARQSDSPAATRNSEDALASPLSSWTKSPEKLIPF